MTRDRGAIIVERDHLAAFADSPFGIAFLDLRGAIVECNDAFAGILCLARGALIGREFTALLAAQDRDDVSARLAKLMMRTATRVSLASLRLLDDRDSERAIEFHGSALEHEGAVASLLVHIRDATDERTREVRSAHAQRLQALGKLAGSVAHDFGNLITALLGHCDLVLGRQGPDGPAYEDMLQIRANALRGRDLVQQLLAFARKQPLRPVVLEVDPAIAALLPMLRRLLGADVEVADTLAAPGAAIRIDPSQFDQVIVNLAVNARDAMPGGGRLSVRSSTIEVGLPGRSGGEPVPPGRYVRIEVADTGTGIAKEIIDDIFQPFFTTKEGAAGTGLGLATVHGIVRQSGGYIDVDSACGEGATFRIDLPALPASEAVATLPAQPAADHGRIAPEPASTPRSVLLVDDEAAVRRFAVRALRGRGHTVIEAEDGESALVALADTSLVLDVLLTDLELPGVHGRAVIDYAFRHRPTLRAVMISAHLPDEDWPLLGDPRLSILPKPFTLAQLADEVRRVTIAAADPVEGAAAGASS